MLTICTVLPPHESTLEATGDKFNLAVLVELEKIAENLEHFTGFSNK